MGWVSGALLSAAILGLVSIVDSHLLSKRLPSLRAFMLPAGIISLISSSVLFYLFPLPDGTSVGTLLVAVASSILRTGAFAIMLYAFKREEVSRVVPVVFTYPILVALMAVPLLGESLYYLEWLAIIIVVAGAVMISSRKSSSGATIWQVKPFLILFSSSLLFALTDITSKYVLAYISSWNLLWLSGFCISGIFLVVSIRPHFIKQLINLKQRNSAMVLIGFSEILALAGVWLLLWALENGPVSLVSAITGSRPIFVFINALILRRVLPVFLDWYPSKGMIVVQLVATAMIVGGITIIYLA